ncbi:ABC transporter permease [Bacillus spongiae]|uniref:ABC transporter permease n=1 Tax=Bacillus spongiae TaxID=2683610 RepID=A0ABU8HC29_9BACI
MPFFIMRREWKEIFATKSLFLTNMIAPIVLLLAAFLTINYTQEGDIKILLDAIKQVNPQLNVLDSQGTVLLARFYFLFFLIIPAVLPLSLATNSIITEKMTGTLETVLVTPITTKHFILGKILAFSIPPVVTTWIMQVVYLLYVYSTFDGAGEFFSPILIICSMFLVPFVSLISVTLSIIVSSKVNNVSAAQQFSILIILPIIAMSISQVVFLSFLSNPLVYIGILAFSVVLSFVAFRLCIGLFSRKNIITKWKS